MFPSRLIGNFKFCCSRIVLYKLRAYALGTRGIGASSKCGFKILAFLVEGCLALKLKDIRFLLRLERIWDIALEFGPGFTYVLIAKCNQMELL